MNERDFIEQLEEEYQIERRTKHRIIYTRHQLYVMAKTLKEHLTELYPGKALDRIIKEIRTNLSWVDLLQTDTKDGIIIIEIHNPRKEISEPPEEVTFKLQLDEDELFEREINLIR